MVHKLGDTEMCLFAHEDYIARFGELVDFTLPEGAFMAGFEREPMPIAPYELGPLPRAAPRFRWRSNNVHALHAAVECSAAVGLVEHPVGDMFLAKVFLRCARCLAFRTECADRTRLALRSVLAEMTET